MSRPRAPIMLVFFFCWTESGLGCGTLGFWTLLYFGWYGIMCHALLATLRNGYSWIVLQRVVGKFYVGMFAVWIRMLGNALSGRKWQRVSVQCFVCKKLSYPLARVQSWKAFVLMGLVNSLSLPLVEPLGSFNSMAIWYVLWHPARSQTLRYRYAIYLGS